MLRIVASLFICLLTTVAIGQDKKKDKWNVSEPQGLDYEKVSFSVSEGTWMNLDVSPDGQHIVFDLLGDIYKLPIAGGKAECIRSGIAWEVQPRFSPDGSKILFTSDAGNGDNIWVMDADGQNPKQITKESFRLLNNPEWMPDGEYIVARKHFTSGRSLGAGEIWMYHTTGGSGVQLTKRKNDQQDVNEPCVSPDGRYIYFSEDMYGGGFFQYNKDPFKQITAVRRFDRQKNKIETVTGGSGGACRPQISPDGNWLSFVRRVDTISVLFLRNLDSGEEYPIYKGLDKDQQEAWTIFGVYPGYDFMPPALHNTLNLVVWAGGGIKRIDISLIPLQESGADENAVKVSEIPFSCKVEMDLAKTVRTKQTVFKPEFDVKAVRQAVTSPDGKWLVFNAVGKLFKRALPDGTPERLIAGEYGSVQYSRGPVENPDMLEFEPAFSKDGQQLVFVTWNDELGGALFTMDWSTGSVKQVNAGTGIFRTPRFSPDASMLVYRLQNGDDELGPSLNRQSGIFTLNLARNNAEPKWVSNKGQNPRFNATGDRIMVSTGGYLFGALNKSLVSYDLNGHEERTIAKSKYVNQWIPSADGKWLAFTELHKAYICAMPPSGKTLDLSASTKAVPVKQVARDAGYNLHWSGDGQKLHYTLGGEYYTIELNQRFDFLPGAPDSIPDLPESGMDIGLKLKTDVPEGKVVFKNARIITCEGSDIIESGVVEVTGNKITFVGPARRYKESKSDKISVIDCTGKTIIPGLVDVHAHSGNFRFGLNPQKQWEYYANLAFGVTTMHDPSVNSEMAFSNAEMIKSGRMIGPRMFSTGTILYGADGDFKAPINSLEDARSALRRTKAWGAFSVKSYNQPRRDQRQQVMAAAKELDMLVVPEGGSFFYHNMNQIVDGHTGVEHNIPVAPLYKDVLEMWRRTKTHNTPTLVVCYGSVNGEYYWYQHTEVWKNQRLLNFTPRHVLDRRSRHREMIPEEEYRTGYMEVSRSLKNLQDLGVNINLGSHGQLQGMAAHWELWMFEQGGMDPLQVLKCGTINGAKYLGMDEEIGSLKKGKLADLVVLDENPLENIRNTESVNMVMVNGRLFDSMTLNEIGNYNRERGKFWFERPGSRINGDAGIEHSCTASSCVCGQ